MIKQILTRSMLAAVSPVMRVRTMWRTAGLAAMRVPMQLAAWAVTLACCLSLSGVALAVEVNSADEAALTSVKGIGPVLAKTIVEERGKKGPFKDPDDLADRVKGLGPKSVEKLLAQGLTIGSRPAPATAIKKESKADKSAAKAR